MADRETNLLNAYEATLTAEMSDVAGSMTVSSTTGLTEPFYLVIEPDSPTQREYVYCSVVAGNVITVTERYLAGSAAGSGLTHPTNSVVRMVVGAQVIADLNDRIDTLGDHGALAGLPDDDHPQYHDDARATTWHTALAGDHVANGDLHDHAGGDGAQIAHSSLSGIAPASSNHVTGGDTHNHQGGDGGVINHSALAGIANDEHTQYLTSARHASEDHSTIPAGVYYADNANAPIELPTSSFVEVVAASVTGVAAGDVIIAELSGWWTNSGSGSPTFYVRPDFNDVFVPSDIGISTSINTAYRHPLFIRFELAVVSASDARFIEQVKADQNITAGALGSTSDYFIWDETTSDLTGTVSVTVDMRQNSTYTGAYWLTSSFIVRKIPSS